MNSLNKMWYSLLTAALLLVSGTVHAGMAGQVQFVYGEVQLINLAGQAHSIKKGGVINEGDTLISSKNASAQIKMGDGGLVALRPDSKLVFNSFKFSGQSSSNDQSYFTLLKGGFRAITGLIGRAHKDSYRITTPTATIGIRGTDHETIVVLPDTALAAITASGTYNKVNTGETSLTTEQGSISVLPNQMGFAGAANEMPTLLPVNTNLFTVAASPSPQASGKKQGDGKEEVRKSEVADSAAINQATATSTPATDVAGNSSVLLPPPPSIAITTTTGAQLNSGGTNLAAFSVPFQANGSIEYQNSSTGVWSLYDGPAKYTSDTSGMTSLVTTTGDTYTRGTASVVDAGTSALVAGGSEAMRWGRWSGTGATLSGAAVGVIAINNLHYVNGSPIAQMPITGTANYTLVGGTHPTDSLGRVGQQTSATASANFTNATLTTANNLTFQGVAYAATGTGTISATGVVTGGYSSTCVPTCQSGSSVAAGTFGGGFNGTNASGLGVTYFINDGTLTISGAQAFKRQ